jgi:hypothetical protein
MAIQDVTDLEVCRQLIEKIINFSLTNRNELLAAGKITNAEYIQIRKEIEEPLRRIHKDITLIILGKLVKPLSAFRSRITSVTTKLNQVIDDLEAFNSSINFLSKIVNLFGAILSASIKGIDGIPDILNAVEALT